MTFASMEEQQLKLFFASMFGPIIHLYNTMAAHLIIKRLLSTIDYFSSRKGAYLYLPDALKLILKLKHYIAANTY